MEAFLLVEHSHHDPEARYSLYDAENWDKIQELLDNEGWVNEDVPVLQLGRDKASFGSVHKLMLAVTKHNISIIDEANSWMDHD